MIIEITGSISGPSVTVFVPTGSSGVNVALPYNVRGVNISSSYTGPAFSVVVPSYVTHATLAGTATSASYAVSASYVGFVTSASHATTAATATVATYAISSSYVDFVESASYAATATTASYAGVAAYALESAGTISTASYAERVLWEKIGDIPSGLISSSDYQDASNIITGTLDNARLPDDIVVVSISASVVEAQKMELSAGNGATFTTTGSISSGIFGVTEYIRPFVDIIRYSGMSVDYIAQRPMGMRIGMLIGLWSGSAISFTDISTADIGSTDDLSMSIVHIGNNAILRVNSEGSGSGAWTIQSVFKLFPRLT